MPLPEKFQCLLPEKYTITFAQITVLATKKEIVRRNNDVTTEVTIIVLCIFHTILIHLVILNFSSLKSTIVFLY